MPRRQDGRRLMGGGGDGGGDDDDDDDVGHDLTLYSFLSRSYTLLLLGCMHIHC